MSNAGANTAASVLVVEDDDDIRFVVADVLRDEGYGVATSPNGLEALQYLRTATTLPGVILLDLMMPVMDGGTFLQHLSGEPLWSEIPVVIMTARGRQFASVPQVVETLAKPVTLHELLDTVEQVCRPDGPS